ncbi:MAG: hypothetical protein PHT07_06805 [Paludibacter sp.]|nr:hypothetical protein [Paludibacter sp.]
MKKNSNFVFSKYNKFSYYINSNALERKLIPIYSFSALIFLLIFVFGPSPTAGDTDTNFSAGLNLANGMLDALRTPLYPSILNFFKLILSNNVAIKLGVIIFQYIIFFISIFCFYYVSEFFIKHKKIVFFVVMCYACHPAILVWQKIIMTESLALSGVVFFLYFIVRFLVTKKTIYSLMINLFVFLLIMLRPGFVFLIPIVLFFWLYFILKYKKNSLLGLSGIIVVIILVIGYSGIFQKQYGVYSLSTVSDINQYIMLRDAGLLETNNIENPEFKKELSITIQKKKSDSDYFDEYIYFYSKYGFAASNKFIHESIKGNLSEYVTYNLNRFIKETINSRIGFWEGFNYNKYNHFIKVLCCPFILLYIFLILYIYSLFKNNFTFKSSLFIYSIAISSIFVLIVGAPNAWGRLIVPTIPILLIMFGQCLEYLRLRPKKVDLVKANNELSGSTNTTIKF